MMQRFFKRIHSKALNVSEAPVLIVALGDSVTQGAMEHGQLSPSIVYHRIFQEKLETFFPNTSFSTINAGVSGDSSLQGLERLERDVLSHSPDLVLVAFGLNDCIGGVEQLSQFCDTLAAIADRVRGESEADLVFLTPPFMACQRSARIHPVHEGFVDVIINAQTSGALSAFAAGIRKVAKEKSALLVDVHTEWERLQRQGVNVESWIINGLNHPDARGHRIAADLLFHRVLTSAAGEGSPWHVA